MATKYHPTLVEDAWAVVCYIREGTVNDKERVIVLIGIINDYFSEYKTRDADMVLRHLVAEALSHITHPTHPRALDNNIILELAVEATSSDYGVTLPSVYDPKSTKVDQSSSHESIYGHLPCEPISGSFPNVVHNDPNSWGATATGENRQAFGKEEAKDCAETFGPKEQAPINIPNSMGRSLGLRIALTTRRTMIKKNVPQVPHMSGMLRQMTYKYGNPSQVPDYIRGPILIDS